MVLKSLCEKISATSLDAIKINNRRIFIFIRPRLEETSNAKNMDGEVNKLAVSIGGTIHLELLDQRLIEQCYAIISAEIIPINNFNYFRGR